MSTVLRNSWPLFLGLLFLMIGNGGQGTLLGVRADFEDIPPETYGFVSAGYFGGFLLGSTITPNLIRKVGHVRVFAALGSLISAAVIVYVWIIDPVAWFVMRVVVGFGFSGVYIVCESWLNEAVDNSQRGKALGMYSLVQMVGVVLGQQILYVGNPESFEPFIILSVLVSISFAPILLTVTPTPISATARPMSLQELYTASPLGAFGSFMLGGVLGVMFGMLGTYGKLIELDYAQISIFATMMYLGAVAVQPGVGWISDRMERRLLIIIVASVSAVGCLLAAAFGHLSLGEVAGVDILALYPLTFIVGGFANPLYPLLAAHTNDYVEHEQMASAASGLLFLNGIGALISPIVVGFLMASLGDQAFWLYMGALLVVMAGFGVYRATQRPSIAVDDTSPFAVVTPRSSAISAEMMQEAVIDQIAADEEKTDEDAAAEAR